MIEAIMISMMMAEAAPMPMVAGEGVGIHEGRRQLGRLAGPAAGQRDDQVVGLDGEVGEHHEGRQEDRPQHRNDDAAVETDVRCAVDLRRPA